jgi:Flp pilus assembly protein TadG
MMKLRTASEAGRRPHSPSHPKPEGGSAVACATAAPLIALGLAVAADHAHVSRFRTQVQLAADAASLAAVGAVARRPDSPDDGARVAVAVFARNAPHGAIGTPSVAATSRAAFVTATVGYDGVAPSNFGSALGYRAIHISASATSRALVADSQALATP